MTALFTSEMELDNTELTRLVVLEATIDRGQKVFVEVGFALAEIRDKRLYRENYKTFEDYCRDRWRLSRPRAYQLIDAAATVNNLSTIVDKLPATESQARPLAGLEPEQQVEVWEKAVATAPNGKPTAAHVEQTKKEYQQPTPPPDEDEQHLDDLAGDDAGHDWTSNAAPAVDEDAKRYAALDMKCSELFARWQVARTKQEWEDCREELYDTMTEFDNERAIFYEQK